MLCVHHRLSHTACSIAALSIMLMTGSSNHAVPAGCKSRDLHPMQNLTCSGTCPKRCRGSLRLLSKGRGRKGGCLKWGWCTARCPKSKGRIGGRSRTKCWCATCNRNTICLGSTESAHYRGHSSRKNTTTLLFLHGRVFHASCHLFAP